MEPDQKDPEGVSIERYAEIAGALAVLGPSSHDEVLKNAELDRPTWAAAHDAWSRRLRAEVLEGTAPGRTGPMDERLPLSIRYAKAYAEAVKRLREEQASASGAQLPPGAKGASDSPKEAP